jgi:hypothetical protein
MTQNRALVIGGTAAILVVPACFISPILLLGSSLVMIVSVPFMTR